MLKLFRRVSARQLGADDAVDVLRSWPNLAGSSSSDDTTPREIGVMDVARANAYAAQAVAETAPVPADAAPPTLDPAGIERAAQRIAQGIWTAGKTAPAWVEYTDAGRQHFRDQTEAVIRAYLGVPAPAETTEEP